MKTKEEKLNELIIPPKKEIPIIKNKKVVYFADPMLTFHCESVEDEWKELPEKQLLEHDIIFEKVHCMTTPPFGKISYDILFFDFGGMSLGNGLLGSFCRHILKEAIDYPGKSYVMVSRFTQLAMKDALEDFDGENKPINIFLSIKDFGDHYNGKEYYEND